MAEQSNIRLPDFPKSDHSPTLPSISHETLPAITKSGPDASTAASLVQLSQSGTRNLPRPFITTPTQQERERSKSDPVNHVEAFKEQQQQQPMLQLSQLPLRSRSYEHTPGYEYNTPPGPARVYYPLYPPQQQQSQPSNSGAPMYSQQGMSDKMKPFSSKSQLSCQRCGTTETPEWRRGPNGARTLCNACGLYHLKLVKRKGALAAAEEMKFKKVTKVARPTRPRAVMALQYSNNGIQNMSKYHTNLVHHHLLSSLGRPQPHDYNNSPPPPSLQMPYSMYQMDQAHYGLQQVPHPNLSPRAQSYPQSPYHVAPHHQHHHQQQQIMHPQMTQQQLLLPHRIIHPLQHVQPPHINPTYQ